MRKTACAAALALLLAGAARAELKVTGPATSPRDHLVELKATGLGEKAQYRWKVTGADAQGRPLSPDVRKWKDRLVFVGPPGTYKVELLSVDFDAKSLEEAEAAVQITGDPAPPPVPPVPPVPPPDDPLVRDLRAALASDAGSPTDKALWVAQLSDLYAEGVKASQDKDIKTVGQLFTIKKAAVDKLLPPGALKGVRTRAQKELAAALPDDPDAPLTQPLRDAASSTFSRLAKATEAIRR